MFKWKKLFDFKFFLQVVFALVAILAILSVVALFFDNLSSPGLDSIYQTYF